MTRYDPFSYGQVELDAKQKAPSESPDDMLFVETPSATGNESTADPNWELLDADVSSLLPNAPTPEPTAEFDDEILGEKLPAAPISSRPRAAAVPTRGESPASGQPVAAPVRRRVGSKPTAETVAELTAVGGVAAPPKGGKARPRLPMVRSRGIAPTLVPAMLFAGGGIASAWLYWMSQNPVMAGLLATLSLVASAFSRTWLRG